MMTVSLLTGPSLPLIPTPLESVTASATSATIRWLISSVAYTPENYTIAYGVSSAQLDSTSDIVTGSQDITVTNAVFEVTVDGLHPFTVYYYKVEARNRHGTTLSVTYSFQSATAGNGVLLGII